MNDICKRLLKYFNEHSGYTISEDIVTDAQREYDKYSHTERYYVIAEDGSRRYVCDYINSKLWGSEGEWIVMKVEENGQFLLSQKDEAKGFKYWED